MHALSALIREHGVSEGALAEDIGISRTSLNKWLRQGRTLQRMTEEELQNRITAALGLRGLDPATVRAVLDQGHPRDSAAEGADDRGNDRQPMAQASDLSEAAHEEYQMLLRKQQLYPATRKHFNLFRDPFNDDVQTADDVFVTPDIRYIREAMWQAAKHGGFLAVVGESGAGKSTLRRDLLDRIRRETAPILVIEPYVLGMEDNDRTGKTLKATHIAEAILATVAEREYPKSSPEARFRQLHARLKDSQRAGYSHVLVIEEAHGLAVPTIKHLKRFFELEDGFRKLLSIILIGQPELRQKLSERNHEVREVVQRCEVAELVPLDDRMTEYLTFKFQRIGLALDAVFEPGGLDALQAKLMFTAKNGKDRVSLMYPLALANLVTAAMNLATEIGAPKVSGDIVREV